MNYAGWFPHPDDTKRFNALPLWRQEEILKIRQEFEDKSVFAYPIETPQNPYPIRFEE